MSWVEVSSWAQSFGPINRKYTRKYLLNFITIVDVAFIFDYEQPIFVIRKFVRIIRTSWRIVFY